MGSLASWYSSQYSNWNRTRRLQVSPYLARTDTRASQTARAMAQAGDAVINMDTSAPKEKKDKDSLFGPNIGIVSTGPAWTITNEKKVVSDELTQEIVKGWIEKSKQPAHPTTTLQALVNLKRPTLRLLPLDPAEDSAASTVTQHGLEFEYDCDSAKCGIYVHVMLPSDHPDSPAPSSSKTGLSKLLVYETVVEGGFGKILKLEDGAVLDLTRFEQTDRSKSPVPSTLLGVAANASTPSLSLPTDAHRAAATPSPVDPQSTLSPPGENSATSNRNRRRFTAFNFRRRHNRGAAGPALAVVDAEPASSSDKKPNEAEGVKVTIRLAALDADGTELASPNEQVTYLHIIRFGAKKAPTPAPDADVSANTEGEKPEEEDTDTRPWVVQVVKREATIGAHTFHLHEIYGLTSASTSNPAPTAPVPTEPATYPPTTPSTATPLLTDAGNQETNDEPSSECLVCLSSPREVVLLPCRHLVACKECALNMVEFGAGGAITHTEEPVTPAPNPSTGGEGDAAGETTDAAANAEGGVTAAPGPTTPAPTAPAPTRRKRKAKGWFCPVCRQPYTSLLRITTTAPPPPAEKDPNAEEKEETSAVTAATQPTPDQPNSRSGGFLAAAFRPTFLRSLSSRGANNDASNAV